MEHAQPLKLRIADARYDRGHNPNFSNRPLGHSKIGLNLQRTAEISFQLGQSSDNPAIPNHHLTALQPLSALYGEGCLVRLVHGEATWVELLVS